uniref:MULE transposase domain-containing protein n=1 Tax=Lactuca sativa TaxID=4236 RepID=A0A9R1VL21_LACSA|nr:hypothetical protein LSAT_V11C500296140 [Lactuca sativa]
MKDYHFGSLVTRNWLAKQYQKDLIMKPKIKLLEMQADVLRRARVTVMVMIEGKLEDHYARVWDYIVAIRLSNSGTTCLVGVESNSGCNYFKRFYVGFKDFRDGWNRGCRKVIGLDGSFLKGWVKGEILIAIGRDAANHVYPIARAVMNVENKDNWTWFIENLVADFDLGVGNGLVVISYQQKGLLQVVAGLLPHVEHRQCLKNLFWEATMSTMEGDFLATMENIKKITETGYTYIMVGKPKTWCRAFFSYGYACEPMENGVAECFNGMIKEIRKKPLLPMLEEIRILLMKRFYHQGQERGNCEPNIQLKIDEFRKDMRLWTVMPSGGDVFETRYGYNGYKFDLATHTCTCNLWMLSGIPCDKYVATYSQNLCSRTKLIKPLPPQVRRMTGRPKLKRVKHACESQDAKYPSQRNDEVPKPPVPKRKIGRPKKDGGGQPIFYQFPLVGSTIPRRDVAPPVLESSNQDGASLVSESGDQDGDLAEEVSLTCDEAFDDLFIHTPNGKQPMSQVKEDVQEKENDNEVKVNEIVTLKELLQYGYAHADAVAAMKEVYGEVEEIDVDERESKEGEVEEGEAEEGEVEEGEVEEEELEEKWWIKL